MSAYDELIELSEGEQVTVTIDDFENTNFPRDENPRVITGEVVNVNEDVNHSGGEITRTVAIGDPRNDGCYIDCGDTAENNITTSTHQTYTYTKAWRPRAGKDRILLGRVTAVEGARE